MDIRSYNREAWNREVESGQNRWSQPVDSETIAKASRGITEAGESNERISGYPSGNSRQHTKSDILERQRTTLHGL